MARKTSALTASTTADLAEAEDIITAEAYALRRKGKSWYQIAEALKITEANAKNRIETAISSAAEMIGEHRKRQLLMLEVDRLDELMAAHYDAATLTRSSVDAEGNAKIEAPSLEAARYVADIIMKRAKLLGLEDMTTVNVTQQTVVVSGTSEEYVAALRLVVGGKPAEDITDAEVVEDEG